MLVEPGFFRTELLTPQSTTYAEPSIEDYAERTRQTVTAWSGMNGRQGGDPARLVGALIQLAGQDEQLGCAGRSGLPSVTSRATHALKYPIGAAAGKYCAVTAAASVLDACLAV